ncbi:MAG: pilus assembly protein PilM [Myxococcales bacterium]|nr:pilus assembly protein PilM [Myxococcota bacterium]MDW8281642.1 pilus assembly protein PilM [Myxococcales bacterium]
MAHTVLGIDLGSHAVKLAQLEVGFRSLRLVALHERELLPPRAPVDGTAEPLVERQVRTVRALCDDLALRPEMTSAALTEGVTLLVLTLPLSDRKKVEQVLPFEMEGEIIGEIDEQIVDHTVAEAKLQTGSEGPGQGCRLVAAAAPRTQVAAFIQELDRAGLEPRLVGASALACAALFGHGMPGPYPAAVIDLGHRWTHFCAIGRQEERGPAATFARSIARGGLQLTQALARALGVDETEAARLKHQADLGLPSSAAGPGRLAATLREALRPLLRDLRQTLASYAALYGRPPEQLWLVGGTARLAGLAAYLSAELDIPTAPLPPPAALLPPTPEAEAAVVSFAPALGLALALAGQTPQVNFRKGELSYRGDYSFLRERAPHLAVMAAAILLCAGLSALASLRVLQQESERLSAALRSETMQLFGEARTDGAAVSAEIQATIASARGGGKGIPTTSALDLLDEISRAAPPRGADKGSLDVTELHIRPQKTDIKGTASSAQYVDDLAVALSKIPCFKEVEKGKVVAVKTTGPDGKPVDVKQFSFSIKTTCP